MLKIEVIAVSRIKKGPFLSLWQEYSKRMSWDLKLTEIEGRSGAEENQKILDKLDSRAYCFILDEKGSSLASRVFADKLDNLAAEGQNHIQFVIGGADGLSKAVREKADNLLSFGRQTWPHKLARIMLIEQIYRASQIIAGHPYHRD